ncbi:MAG: biotin-dependent carboxyltransferase family protein [Pseudorhodoplanes sp.]
MKPALRILSPGLMTSVQDLGRSGYQRLGIPVGGALDADALQAANALAGNDSGSGALEVMYVGPTFAVEAESVRLAFVGADAPIDVFEDEQAQVPTRIGVMRTVCLQRGQVVRIGSLARGATLYIAVEGGFDIAPVLGSVSTYARGRMGGCAGRPLVAGDLLPLRQEKAATSPDRALIDFDLPLPRSLRVLPGPQRDHFADGAWDDLLAGEYVIGAGSDRMGMRLEGRKLHHAGGFDIVSDAVAPGSIQVPGHGQPIVLLADRQTTGGYPKIATVISADLPALGRLPIGARIGFRSVTMEEAQAARRQWLAGIAQIAGKIVPLRRSESEIAAKLLEANLISGVFDAAA